MLLDRLIRREKRDNIAYGSVSTIDTKNRRVLVTKNTGISVWASYLPGEYSDLKEDDIVAIGESIGNAFLLSRVSIPYPSDIDILAV